MTFINHINFVATLNWGKLGAFNDFPDVIDTCIARRVNFNDIECITRCNAFADLTDTTRLLCRLILLLTVERLC